MKTAILKFALRHILSYILNSRDKVDHVVALAETSYNDGDKPFNRRGRVYRFVKDWAPAGTPQHLLNLGTEVAQTLDELQRGK